MNRLATIATLAAILCGTALAGCTTPKQRLNGKIREDSRQVAHTEIAETVPGLVQSGIDDYWTEMGRKVAVAGRIAKWAGGSSALSAVGVWVYQRLGRGQA